ncbi:hypothetical protein TSTA_064520 [Talaromyces stipitatus ATCC 10500]|uniref:Uncharacterized protein n=1 Tax=Talaromyces stipitatus (strain ATCC 10500 / CBS 375.48 / QM 6759 / NRRL 1006) TaxID=441959 RepID=B8LSY9_TALSN|nr:uncharacterized protein TSTA_064520 [Talaromyces stipitatus ATCC 10500]EED22985.1 hypothetical protein TSTA_064520 [Talaromyces stipitatus ATCC 10500]
MSGLGSTRHACHCGKSFIRKEHLTRHQATHNKPAYVCNVCQRQFSRKDLLRRHASLHEASHTRMVVSCEACRANKSKCSGGTRCSRCARRGIECIYRGGPPQAKRMLRSDESEAEANASVREDTEHEDGNDELTLLTSSTPETSLSWEVLQRNVQFLKTITIVSPQLNPSSGCLPLGQGMEGIYELLIAEESSLEVAMEKSDGMKGHVSRYTQIYLKNFHLRWPILHGPTLSNEIDSISLPLAASMCLIGAWFQDSKGSNEILYALKVHDILLERLLHSLTEPDLVSAKQAWPIEVFQAVLLTLIFSLYRTDKVALSRAMLLRSGFITILRELEAFNAEKLATHLQTYYSGSYAPYTIARREQFRRLLVSTYQFDSYFGLAHGKPPLLHCQEVGVFLPSSFALWNAYGVDIFAMRQVEEMTERSGVKVSELANHTDTVASTELLVEDVQLGLCNILHTIWVLGPADLNKVERPTHNLQTSLFIQKLDDWKHELDKIEKLIDLENVTKRDAAKHLLLAYRGEDDSAVASLERITTLMQDGIILYYYLKMFHYVSQIIGPGTRIESSEIWQTSKYGREALVCALQILKIVESRVSSNPLIRYALATGVDVMRVSLSGQRCECLARKGQHAANRTHPQWSDTGGPFRIDGTPVCVCKLTFWSDRFEKGIQGQKIMVE